MNRFGLTRSRAAAIAFALPVLLAGVAAGQQPRSQQFEARVAPLLAKACLECHSPTQKQGGLDLTTLKGALAGGARGPGLVPGKPEASWVWKRVASGEMPPKHPLTAAERGVLKQWIAAGAPWSDGAIDPLRYSSERRAGYDWWSLQPVSQPPLPAVKQKSWPITPVDRFVLAKLEAAGLKPSPPAERAVLIRRLYFDMLGLPPRPDEVDAFVQDRRSDAYERLVDGVLASPHYGERWARHWLDVIRFGESQGFERNKLRPNAWKYRDWVVDALNTDLPYDEFVRLQIAGDVLRPDDPLAVIASGFLVMGPYDYTVYTAVSPMMRAVGREEELEGLVGTVTQTFLGLTVNCARCHDHKFDPISQKEYYRVAAALGGTYHGPERDSLSAAGKVATQQERDRLTARVAAFRARLAILNDAILTADERERIVSELALTESRSRLLAGGPTHVTVPQAPGVFHVLARGDFRAKGEAVAPGGVAALTGPAAEWGLKQDAPEPDRRKALAAWLTDPKNPLTARVMVNRVWSYHFGAGLVPTPSDFGFNGGLPSHPELLDWLASNFIAGVGGQGSGARRESFSSHAMGWSVKKLHRLLLLSATYRQSSRPVPAAKARDAENRLLWRHNPQRLAAESLRDAALSVSGELNPALGGPGFRDWTMKSNGDNEVYTVFDAVGPEFNRRTLYRMVVRSGGSPLLDGFDCPDPSVATPKRTVTTTPLQALSLLNNKFMEHVAGKWAAKLQRDAPSGTPAQVTLAYRQAFARPPNPDEIRFAETFAAKHGLPQLCLVLLNTNEFLYVD